MVTHPRTGRWIARNHQLFSIENNCRRPFQLKPNFLTLVFNGPALVSVNVGQQIETQTAADAEDVVQGIPTDRV